MSHRINQSRAHAQQVPDHPDASRSQDAGPARPAAGGPRPSAAEDARPAAGAARLTASLGAKAASVRVTTARSTAAALTRELPGSGVDIDAFATRFAGPHYAGASKGQIASTARYEFTRAALAHNPALADHAIAMRTRGQSKVVHQIVQQEVARSGAKGMQKLAVAEHAIGAVQHLSPEHQADVLALVQTGDSVSQAVKGERAALAEIATEQKVATHTRSPAAGHGFDVAAQTARFQKIYQQANAEFRRLPVLSRGAEITTGVASSIGAVTSVAVGAAHSTVTLDGSHVARAVDKAGNSGGYIAGELSDHIHKANGLYMQLATQHDEFVQLSRQVSSAVKTHDYDAVPAAMKRMKTLAGQMDATSKQFLAAAHRVDKDNREFNAATVDAAEDIVFTAATLGASVGTKGLVALGAKDAVKDLGEEVGVAIPKSEVQKRANHAILGGEE